MKWNPGVIVAVGLMVSALGGDVRAETGVGTYEGPRMGRPSFWEGSIAVGVARTTWTYYHVSNIPKASILHVPVLPKRPQDSPHWPKERLDAPREVDGMLYDPQVEQAKKSWYARVGVWIRKKTGMERLWKWIKEDGSKIMRDPDILFLPDVDSPEVIASTIYRYSPPDEFVQFIAEGCLFIAKDAGEKEREEALKRARKENKFLLVMDRNTRPKTIHNEEWRREWTVHVRPPGMDVAGQEVVAGEKPEIKQRTPSPMKSGEQLDRVWTVLRQTDLATGHSIDELVGQSGESGLLWPLGPAGARMEIWHLRWGTMQWNLVTAQSIGPDGKAMGWGSFMRPVVYESQAQSVTVEGMEQQRLMVSWWLEDAWGLTVTGMGGVDQLNGPAWKMASVPPHEGRMQALLWAMIEGRWQWLAMESCQVRPIPRVELDWPAGKPVPSGGGITVRGNFFTPGAGLRLSVGGKVVREWVTDRTEWKAGVDLSGQRRRVVVAVETQAPWKSASEIPTAWPWVRLAQWPVTIQ